MDPCVSNTGTYTSTHTCTDTHAQCCTVWGDYMAITAVTVTKWKLILGEKKWRKCHSKFSVYPEISELWITAFSFDHRRCCLSPIHRWIIPPKSPKSLILFISTPHKKGALFPLLSLCVQYGCEHTCISTFMRTGSGHESDISGCSHFENALYQGFKAKF